VTVYGGFDSVRGYILSIGFSGGIFVGMITSLITSTSESFSSTLRMISSGFLSIPVYYFLISVV
jgi:hypothetical protein